jgi:hypothetical protein
MTTHTVGTRPHAGEPPWRLAAMCAACALALRVPPAGRPIFLKESR